MTKCKYWDCGWCYAPNDVETSANSQSACFDPDYCPYLKSQMTEMYGGNTPIVPDETVAEWELEEKLRRATEKVMNSQTEINTINLKNYIDKKVVVFHRNLKKVEGYIKYNNQFPDYPYKFNDRCYTKNGKILIDNKNGWDIYEIFPTTEVTSLPKPIIIHEGNDIIVSGVRYRKVEEPEQLKTLREMFYENGWNARSSVEFCNIVKEWMSQYTHNVMSGEYLRGYEDCMLVLEENLKNDL